MASGNQQLGFAIRAVNEASKAMKDIHGDLGVVEKKAKDADKASGGLGKTLGDVSKIAGGFIIAQGLMKLPGLFSSSASAASNFQETLSKANTIFGDQAKAIEDWAGTAARAFGQSKTQALDAAGTFGNMFTQLGIGSSTAADMSMKMTELASDFASFHNADISEVLSAQTAAFRGEYDAVQRFVPTINAAAVEQKALALHLASSTKELTAQDKAIATEALLLEGAGKAMGDFGRTAEGAANKQRILQARMDDLNVKIGALVLPIKVLITEGFLRLADAAEKVFDGLRAGFTGEGGRLVTRFYEWGEALRTVWDFGSKVAGLTWGALTDLAKASWDVMQKAWEVIQPLLEKAAAYTWGALTDLAKASWDVMQKAWEVIQPLLEKAAAYTWGALVDLANASWSAMKDALALAVEQLNKIPAGKIRDEARDTSNWAAAWAQVREKVQPAVDVLRPLVEELLVHLQFDLKVVRESLGRLNESFGELWEALKPLQPILEPLAKLIGGVLVLGLVAAIKQVEAMAIVLTVVLAGSMETARLAILLIADAIKLVTKAVQDWAPAIGNAMSAVWQVWDANVSMIIARLHDIVTSALDFASDMFNAGVAMMTGLWEGLKSKLSEVKDWFKTNVNPANWGWRSPLPHSMYVEGLTAGSVFTEGLAAGFTGIPSVMTGVRSTLSSAINGLPLYVIQNSPFLRSQIDTGFISAAGGARPSYIGGGQYGLLPTKDVPAGYYNGSTDATWTGDGWQQGSWWRPGDPTVKDTMAAAAARSNQPQVIQLVVDGAVLAEAVANQQARTY